MCAFRRATSRAISYRSREDHDRSTPDATHAWVEALMPHLGWVGVDPTNNLIAHHRHIRTAVGRDYADVPPTHGVFRGKTASELYVAVQVEASERAAGARPQAADSRRLERAGGARATAARAARCPSSTCSRCSSSSSESVGSDQCAEAGDRFACQSSSPARSRSTEKHCALIEHQISGSDHRRPVNDRLDQIRPRVRDWGSALRCS